MTTLDPINRAATYIIVVATILMLLVAAQVAVWALDNDPPFELISYTATPAKPGGTTLINASVERSIERGCSATFSRAFFDSRGARFDIGDGAYSMNAHAIEAQNKAYPNKMLLAIRIPDAAAPGRGSLMTVLDYQCNPLQMFNPIPVVLFMDVEVLP